MLGKFEDINCSGVRYHLEDLLIDGQRSLGKIFDLMRAFQTAAGQRSLCDAEFFDDFRTS